MQLNEMKDKQVVSNTTNVKIQKQGEVYINLNTGMELPLSSVAFKMSDWKIVEKPSILLPTPTSGNIFYRIFTAYRNLVTKGK